MSKKGKAVMLSLPTCPNGVATPTRTPFLLPAKVEPLHSPDQLLKLVLGFLEEKGIPLQRQNYVKLNSMNINSPSERSVPWLSLSGVWLQNAGFRIYEDAKTIAVPGMLIIIPGHNRPLVTPSDARCISRIANKLNNYVQTQK